MSMHFKDVCTCGAVIAQCRCLDTGKQQTNIIQDGCAVCRAKLPGATYLHAPLAPKEPLMRTLTSHIVAGDSAKHQLQITVMDEPGAGGANHDYRVSGTYKRGEIIPAIREMDDAFTINTDDSVTLTLGRVRFQDGPIQEAGVNGVTHEALLAIVIDRLRSFQAGPFASPRNEAALAKCAGALDDLQMRTRDRIARGVEGKNQQ